MPRLNLKVLISLFMMLVLTACNNSEKPNIILIMADDLGYGDLGCYGSQKIQTPNIDKLAEGGVKFMDYHSNGAVCSPTRAALMTGRYQQRSGIQGVVTAANHRHTGLSTEEYTIAESFQAAGYSTAMLGKWHLGYDKAFFPVRNGFDFFKGYVSGNVDYHSHIDQSGHYDWWMNTDTLREEGYVTDLLSKASLEFIKNRDDRPFFLYLAHEAPHYPFQGRNDIADRSVGGSFDNLGSRPDREGAYIEMIEAMDEGIGELMDLLEGEGLLENTFIFFCSDNGAIKLGSNGTLRGHKASLWEGGHRVPAIASWKGHISPGVNRETVLSMDIFPSMVSLHGTGLPENHKLDGISFMASLLKGETLPERPLFWRFKKQRAVRKGPWKLLFIDEEPFLFNLDSDPGEQTNLYEEKPRIGEELLNLLNEWELEMSSYALRAE